MVTGRSAPFVLLDTFLFYPNLIERTEVVKDV